MPTPEELARINIDRQLTAAGWVIQDRAQMNLYAGCGVAVREFPLQTGEADYLLFVDRKAVGVVEAKPEGTTLSGVADQAAKYSVGLPPNIPHVTLPLPFLYESTGVETFFRDERDPQPRSRRVFTFHRPETLADWAESSSVRADGVRTNDGDSIENGRMPSAPTLRGRFQQYPPLNTTGLWKAQIEAINNLEASLAQDKPRSLIQMATGSGKTFTAVSFIYRMIKFGKARRILFLVDRANLARQTLKEFQAYTTPDDGRKFTELYNVQHLQNNAIDPVNRVVITTIQRVYSMLRGEDAYDEGNEEGSLFEADEILDASQEKKVEYNPRFPIEMFDVIITDECHRSIYNLWRQVLEYFDAHLIGLTATPSKQTFGFFNQNLVMEYTRARAVLDKVNVDGEVYRIRTKITEKGSSVDAEYWVGKRDKLTRRQRWEQLDEALEYDAKQLDVDVVSEGQIRLIIRTYRDRLFSEIFPGRSEVPKTLIFAKDDSHAEDIVRIVREEFGKDNEFCQKITYRVSGKKPEDLIAAFRNSYNPRVAVTVDMIATGTDIKPLECLLFMRTVKSRVLFEQMLGRGTRVISPTDLQAVTVDAPRKERFVIVDAVGVVDQPKVDTQTLERKKSVPFDKLLEAVALGARDEDTLSSLAGRLARLERTLNDQDRYTITAASGGQTLGNLARGLLDARDPDRQLAAAQAAAGVDEPSDAQIARAAEQLIDQAAAPFDNHILRNTLIAIQQRNEQTIDQVSVDRVLETGFSADATAKARTTVESFRQFLLDHRDEITALQILLNQPQSRQRLTFGQRKELARQIAQPPLSLTTEALWRAYAQLEQGTVRGAGAKRVLADLVALIRHAIQPDGDLAPYPEQVQARYGRWLAQQEAKGRQFSPEQRWWLDHIAVHIGVNLSVAPDDFEYGDFFNRGGPVAAARAFGRDWPALLDELNTELAA